MNWEIIEKCIINWGIILSFIGLFYWSSDFISPSKPMPNILDNIIPKSFNISIILINNHPFNKQPNQIYSFRLEPELPLFIRPLGWKEGIPWIHKILSINLSQYSAPMLRGTVVWWARMRMRQSWSYTYSIIDLTSLLNIRVILWKVIKKDFSIPSYIVGCMRGWDLFLCFDWESLTSELKVFKSRTRQGSLFRFPVFDSGVHTVR